MGSLLPVSRKYVENIDAKEGDTFQIFKWGGEYYLTPSAMPPQEQVARLEELLKPEASGQRKSYRDVDDMIRAMDSEQ